MREYYDEYFEKIHSQRNDINWFCPDCGHRLDIIMAEQFVEPFSVYMELNCFGKCLEVFCNNHNLNPSHLPHGIPKYRFDTGLLSLELAFVKKSRCMNSVIPLDQEAGGTYHG